MSLLHAKYCSLNLFDIGIPYSIFLWIWLLLFCGQNELESAKTEINKWKSAFQNESFVPAGKSPGLSSILQSMLLACTFELVIAKPWQSKMILFGWCFFQNLGFWSTTSKIWSLLRDLWKNRFGHWVMCCLMYQDLRFSCFKHVLYFSFS